MNNVIVVTSGKGGVGKSTLTAIIGKSLSSYYKVLLIDGDIGLKNLENCLSLDLNNKDITDVLMGRCSLEEAITHVEKNLDLMSLCQRDNVKNFDTNLLSTLIDMVEKDYEYIVIDSPAGIENGFHSAIKRATKAIVVLNDEPNSYSDGRKVTRILKAKRIKEIHYVINKYNGKQYEKDKIRQFVASYYLSSNCYFLPLFNNIKKMKMHQIIKKEEVQKLTYNITKNIKGNIYFV